MLPTFHKLKRFQYNAKYCKKKHTKIKYSKEELMKIFKPYEPTEKFVNDLHTLPLETYAKFYNRQFDAVSNDEIILKIIADINTRLGPISVLNMPQFEHFKQSLQNIRNNGINLLLNNMINPSDLYTFVIDYIEIMYDILKSADNNIKGTYHTQFTKGFIKKLYNVGNNTQLFFTFENVNDQYLIDIRPTCIYFNQLLDIPEFSYDMNTYKQNILPLIPTNHVQKRVEGNMLDIREFTLHDLGHSYVMNRQDEWLFDNLNRNCVELVEEWIKNKNLYKSEYMKLPDINLRKAIQLYLFDIVHDRGYQFYLPILRQQIRAKKNLENIKTKIIRGNFEGITDTSVLKYIDAAREWLLDITNKFIVKDNTDKIDKYRKDGYIIKKYLDVESCTGIPTDVIICAKGKIRVKFSCEGIIRTTSIYEIELLGLPTNSDIILSENKINDINKWINMMNNNYMEFLKLDSDANICNLPGHQIDDNIEDHTNYNLKGIETYKLERLFRLIKNGTVVNFSVTKLPDIYESDKICINKNSVVIDTGISFKMNEISVENKPKSTSKYINLDAHARFVPADVLERSYIKYPYTTNPYSTPYVIIKLQNDLLAYFGDDLHLGIIKTTDIVIAKAVSSVLTRSVEYAKVIYPAGYLPESIVENAQLEYVSPYAISNLWGRSGYRFVLSRNVGHNKREIIATALIADSKDTLFFFTNKLKKT